MEARQKQRSKNRRLDWKKGVGAQEATGKGSTNGGGEERKGTAEEFQPHEPPTFRSRQVRQQSMRDVSLRRRFSERRSWSECDDRIWVDSSPPSQTAGVGWRGMSIVGKIGLVWKGWTVHRLVLSL